MCGLRFADFQIYLKDHQSYSPQSVVIKVQQGGEGAPWVEVKKLSLPLEEKWFTLIEASEPPVNTMPGISGVRFEIKTNHQGGCDSHVCCMKVNGFAGPNEPWDCVLCGKNNTPETFSCVDCSTRKPLAKCEGSAIELSPLTEQIARAAVDECRVELIRRKAADGAPLPSEDDDEDDDDESNTNSAADAEMLQVNAVLSSTSDLGPIVHEEPDPTANLVLMKQSSDGFDQLDQYEPLEDLNSLLRNRDKAGNSAAHHAALIGLGRTLKALFVAGASRWTANSVGLTVALVAEQGGLHFRLPVVRDLMHNHSPLDEDLRISKRLSRLHRACTKRGMLPSDVVMAVLRTPEDATTSAELDEVVKMLFEDGEGEHAVESGYDSVRMGVPHARVYYAIALQDAGYGSRAARLELDTYVAEFVETLSQNPTMHIDPLYFYAKYLLWRTEGSQKSKVC
jgi:hypothetical protein